MKQTNKIKAREGYLENMEITNEVLDNLEWIDRRGNKAMVKSMPSDRIRRILTFLSFSKVNNKKWISVFEAETKRRKANKLCA